MCELPNDAARRAALGSLPPDLNSTYERILSRVNQCNLETQKVVRRALRWIANDEGDPDLTVEALCEAISIDLDSTRRNPEAISDDYEILRRCSSLVRRSEDGGKLELAHFTVKEFLQQIDPQRDLSIGKYRVNAGTDQLIMAKVCLTYLNFEDFNHGGLESPHTLRHHFPDCAFRCCAVNNLVDQIADNMYDTEYFSLVQKLLSPSKPNTFISWMHDNFVNTCGYFGSDFTWLLTDESELVNVRSGFAEVTALHYAALFNLTEICSWLIGSGCDVNRNTKFGTPLHFAILNWWALFGKYENPLNAICRVADGVFVHHDDETINLLLESGADPNCMFSAATGQLSPLFMVLFLGRWNQAMQLLDKGGKLDNTCLEILENHSRCEDVARIMEHAGNNNVVQDNRDRLFRLALRAKTPEAARLIPKLKDLSYQNLHYEQNLRTAAEYGQVEIILGLLEDQSLDINAEDKSTGLTALHHAAKTDQLRVAQVLLDRGADLSRLDNLRRTALHHSVLSGETNCLQLFLQKGADTGHRDLEGMTVWHFAAQEGNLEALSVLSTTHTNLASLVGLEAEDGGTALLYASENGNVEAMSLLLSAGSNLNERGSDGSTPLHYAAMSGSSTAVEFLAKNAGLPDVVTHDGSTALHYAIMESSKNLAEILHILIENGVDPCKARNDGCTPLQLLVSMIKDESNEYGDDALDQMFAAGRTLLERMLETSRSTSDLRLGSELIYLACSYPFPGMYGVVLSLLKLGLDLNARFAGGKNALMAAAEEGDGEILDSLLTHGADPCIVDDLGSNALHFACCNGHKNVLSLLRNTSIDWNKESTANIMETHWRKRVTPLHIAAQSDSRVLEYLLNQDLTLNVDACTDKGETPLSVAVWRSAPENVSLLLSKEADTTLIDSYDYSAVHWAAKSGYEEVITEFIKHGTNLGLPNSQGLTPELVARKYGHEVLATTIMDYVNEQSEFHHFILVKCGWTFNDIRIKTMNPMPSRRIRHQAKPMGDRRHSR